MHLLRLGLIGVLISAAPLVLAGELAPPPAPASASAPASAADRSAAPENARTETLQVWLSPGFYSVHFDRSKNLRNDNIGPGIEVAFTPVHALVAGNYINSNGARTDYVGYAWRPWHADFHGAQIGLGALVSAFDGYPNYRNGGWFIAPLPLLSVETRYVGVNLSVIPTIANRLDGAVSLQFKLRVW